jgi:hypothetical protein
MAAIFWTFIGEVRQKDHTLAPVIQQNRILFDSPGNRHTVLLQHLRSWLNTSPYLPHPKPIARDSIRTVPFFLWIVFIRAAPVQRDRGVLHKGLSKRLRIDSPNHLRHQSAFDLVNAARGKGDRPPTWISDLEFVCHQFAYFTK